MTIKPKTKKMMGATYNSISAIKKMMHIDTRQSEIQDSRLSKPRPHSKTRKESKPRTANQNRDVRHQSKILVAVTQELQD